MARALGFIVSTIAAFGFAYGAQAQSFPDGFEAISANDAATPETGMTYARIVPGGPVVLVLQGSGCDSVWQKTAQGLAPVAVQNLPAVLMPDRTVMVVDKPSVAPGTRQECSADFTLPAWSAHLDRAIASVREAGDYAGPIAVLGISEGAATAAHLAANREDISHVVFVSAAGCLLIDDMIANATRQAAIGSAEDGLETWDRIEQASGAAQATAARIFSAQTPDEERIWGQPVAYWRTFGAACPARDLAVTDANVFVAFGTSDEQVIAEGIEEIVARRIIAGKPIEVRRVGEGKHILTRPGDSNPSANLVEILREAMAWIAAN